MEPDTLGARSAVRGCAETARRRRTEEAVFDPFRSVATDRYLEA